MHSPDSGEVVDVEVLAHDTNPLREVVHRWILRFFAAELVHSILVGACAYT